MEEKRFAIDLKSMGGRINAKCKFLAKKSIIFSPVHSFSR